MDAFIPATTENLGLAIAGTALIGLAVMSLVVWVFQTLESGDLAQGDDWRYDVTRINELRRQDLIYRLFQPLIVVLARFNRAAFRSSLPEVQRHIQAAGLPRFWLPEEYLARGELLAMFLSPIYFVLCWKLVGPAGVVLALTLTLLTAWWFRHRLRVRAITRLQQIKRRMPYLLDLLTLLMEAGATFLRALEDAANEFQGQPIAAEFRRVLADINMGKTRTEAFTAMRNRLDDNDITSIIGAITQGEHLGTPLAGVFRTQADVLRIKRAQNAETLAGEAGVNMLFPGVLVMVSSVCVILGPFLLNYLYFGLSL